MEPILRDLINGADLEQSEYDELLTIVTKATNVDITHIERAIINKDIICAGVWRALDMLGIDPQKWYVPGNTYDLPASTCNFVKHLKAYSCAFNPSDKKCTLKSVAHTRHVYCLEAMLKKPYTSQLEKLDMLSGMLDNNNVFMMKIVFNYLKDKECDAFFKDRVTYYLRYHTINEYVINTLIDNGYVPDASCLEDVLMKPWGYKIWERVGFKVSMIRYPSHVLRGAIVRDNLDTTKYLIENGVTLTDQIVEPCRRGFSSYNRTLEWLAERYPDLPSLQQYKASIVRYQSLESDHF